MILKSIRNERGQMAIFVALIFQVLFVLFAMSINVALVVHDKINLQNAVDLAAYYAAQRQAEILNVIAHQNYQIRQGWKLLAWRNRVMGTMGIQRPPHPSMTLGNRGMQRQEEPYPPAASTAENGSGVCVTYNELWKDVISKENLCNRPGLRIPPLPKSPVIASFNPINAVIAAISDQLINNFNRACANHGAVNWWMAASMMQAFREDQRNRKQILYAMANSLSRNQEGDFFDLQGTSVLAGARKVFQKNLTFENERGGPQMEMFNSLAGVDPRKWLVEMNVQPWTRYVDAADIEGCVAEVKNVNQMPAKSAARNSINSKFDPSGHLRSFTENSVLSGDDMYNFAVGVEKNPWYVAYVGVKASSSPRQLFFPFGGSIQLVARAYAKPFGGRIGPWFSDRWPEDAPYSTGKKIDDLLPARRPPGSLAFDSEDPNRFPNYSRFPGDQMGMTSKLAQAAFNGMRNVKKMSFGDFRTISLPMQEGAVNDPLASPFDGRPYDYRNLEISALAPDLFDITYYSIEPNFDQHYRRYLVANRGVLGIPDNVPIRGDLGARDGDVSTSNFVVERQLEIAKQWQAREAFYLVREKSHLLTAWAHNAQMDLSEYTFPEWFGRCGKPDTQTEFKNPGSCLAQGGRTGYSVKIVSRDFLKNRALQYGGPSEAAATIKNPPPEGW